MSEVFDWNTEGAGETEICQLEDAFSINQKILWFQITMENLMFVAFSDTIQQLVQERL
jgi:hypothetical protein